MGTYYGPKVLEPYMQAFWDPVGFLDGEWSQEKQQAFNNLYNLHIFGTRPFGDQFDIILDNRNDSRYMSRYGISWSDVKDPRKLSQSRHSTFNSSLNFVSSNIDKLY